MNPDDLLASNHTISDLADQINAARKAGNSLALVGILDGVGALTGEHAMSLARYRREIADIDRRLNRSLQLAYIAAALCCIGVVFNCAGTIIRMATMGAP
jgi:hypothetical protein